MSANPATSHEREDVQTYSVSGRQKLGDVVVLVLLAPIFCAMLGLLLAIPAAVLIYGLELGANDAQRARLLVGSAAAAAVPLSLLALRFKLCWSITLFADGLRLGSSLLGRVVSYDQVRFLRAGEQVMSGGRRRSDSSGSAVPLQIELASRPKRCRIWLPASEARLALRELHRRSDATALDLDGTELLSKDPQRRAAGVRHLVRLYRVAAAVLLTVGLALVGIIVSVAVDQGLDDWAEMLEVIIGAVSTISGGLAAAHKARRAGRRRAASATGSP